MPGYHRQSPAALKTPVLNKSEDVQILAVLSQSLRRTCDDRIRWEVEEHILRRFQVVLQVSDVHDTEFYALASKTALITLTIFGTDNPSALSMRTSADPYPRGTIRVGPSRVLLGQ